MSTPGLALAGRVVVITDAEQRASLAAIRSLGRAGCSVVACSHVPHAVGAASRFVARTASVPSPFASPEAWAQAVRAVVETTGAHVLLPVTEAAHLALFEHGVAATLADTRGVVVAAPLPDAFLRAADKALVRDCARDVGLAVPEQVVIEAPGARPGSMAMPCVIKPARSVSVGDGPRLRGSVRYADTESALDAALADTPAALYPLLLQERVSGAGLGVSLLRWNGRTLGVSGHRRLREKPVEGGVSVACETVDVPDAMLARCEALLASLGYDAGLAMIEFKGDDLAAPRLMEINPRLWGSVQLAFDAGVDFPALLVRAALGESVSMPSPVRSRGGVRLRWWWGTVDHALQRVRRGLDHRGEAQAGGRPAVLAALFRERVQGAREEVWRADDPRPFVVESWNWVRRR